MRAHRVGMYPVGRMRMPGAFRTRPPVRRLANEQEPPRGPGQERRDDATTRADPAGPLFSLCPPQRPAPPSSRRLPTPRAPRPGAVDGAWWPCTSDLVAELSGLEALLGRRAGSIDRIMYNIDA
ncbi:DUF5994 family protein [Nocardia sp. NPDC051981]|uniref:DUF5994 family protein n=1 Tax=Nocardia sp. NPDC051981 TaxID=3155417 RepID=UPI0034302418